jgi:hypothetical protein
MTGVMKPFTSPPRFTTIQSIPRPAPTVSSAPLRFRRTAATIPMATRARPPRRRSSSMVSVTTGSCTVNSVRSE